MGKSAEICWRGRWRTIEIKYINRSYEEFIIPFLIVSIAAYGASGERKSRTGGRVGESDRQGSQCVAGCQCCVS